jgi:alpha-amylase
MHKKMQHLSLRCREKGNPEVARRAIGRAQCNDAYWHGVFGGLYLPHLRRAIWHQLAIAECELRVGESLTHEFLDFDADGYHEIWIHSAEFSALVSPARGAAVEEYTVFGKGLNYADVLTRRREAYHRRAVEQAAAAARSDQGGAASIHDIEHAVTLSELPPADSEDRALFVDRLLPGSLRFDEFARGDYQPIRSWARAPMAVAVERLKDVIELVCRPVNAEDQSLIEKRLRFDSHGALRVSYRWNPAGLPLDALFSTELTLAEQLPMKLNPEVGLWTFAVHTVAKSERGLDETLQGESITPRWPVGLGQSSLELLPGRADR